MPKQNGKCAAKIAAKKEKIAAKIGKKAAKALTLAIALGCFTGCMGSNPASRATSATYGDIVVKIGENASNNAVKVNLGDGAIASADSAGSTETQTSSPTQKTDVSPKTDVNTTGGRSAGVLESIVSAFGSWLMTPSGKAAAIDSAKSTTNCSDGSCTTGNCTTGNCAPCTTGNCTDGSCSECTLK